MIAVVDGRTRFHLEQMFDCGVNPAVIVARALIVVLFIIQLKHATCENQQICWLLSMENSLSVQVGQKNKQKKKHSKVTSAQGTSEA